MVIIAKSNGLAFPNAVRFLKGFWSRTFDFAAHGIEKRFVSIVCVATLMTG